MQFEKASRQEILATLDKLVGFYPNFRASDPQTFTAGMVELMERYSRPTVFKAASPVFGLPGLYKFFPSIAEIKECLDKWEAETAPKPAPKLLNGPSEPPRPVRVKKPGEDYFSMFEKYGRPIGPFDRRPKEEAAE